LKAKIEIERELHGAFTDACDISKLNDISEYLCIISECDIKCPLEFWKKWQNHLPGFAKIAKKY